MINSYDVTGENKGKNNENFQQFPDHQYNLVSAHFALGKANALINSINHQYDIDEIYLYAKVSYEAKCELKI